jgi:hypothetical protein
MNFFEIAKNASRLVAFLGTAKERSGGFEKDAVIIREPFSRFWSAVKTIDPEISFYGSYPPNNTELISSYSSQESAVDVMSAIDRGIESLNAELLDIHLRPQSAFIAGSLFDYVWTHDETLLQQIKTSCEESNVSFCDGLDFDQWEFGLINKSPHDKDDEAMSYIMNTPAIKQRLEEFYAEDFAIWNNPNVLLKPEEAGV